VIALLLTLAPALAAIGAGALGHLGSLTIAGLWAAATVLASAPAALAAMAPKRPLGTAAALGAVALAIRLAGMGVAIALLDGQPTTLALLGGLLFMSLVLESWWRARTSTPQEARDA
jgi:hypothetical protein